MAAQLRDEAASSARLRYYLATLPIPHIRQTRDFAAWLHAVAAMRGGVGPGAVDAAAACVVPECEAAYADAMKAAIVAYRRWVRGAWLLGQALVLA